MPACRRSLRHDPYPEGIRSIYDAAVYDGKKSCSSMYLLNSLAMAQAVPDGPREEFPRARARLRRPRLHPCPARAEARAMTHYIAPPTPAHHLGPWIWGARLRRGAVALRAATADANPPTLPLRNLAGAQGVLGRFGTWYLRVFPVVVSTCTMYHSSSTTCARSLPISPLRDTGRWSRPV